MAYLKAEDLTPPLQQCLSKLASLLTQEKVTTLARPIVHTYNLMLIRKVDKLLVDKSSWRTITQLADLAQGKDEGAYLMKNTMKPLELRRTLEKQLQPYGSKTERLNSNPKLANWWKEYL